MNTLFLYFEKNPIRKLEELSNDITLKNLLISIEPNLNVIKTHQVNDLKALACDKYACVAGLRTDKRNIVFKEKK